MRIGQGFDVHALREGGRLILGGVEIAHSHGLVAHSDGDVLLHALCDALLGAAGLGDIGRHFPDSDAAYQGVDSRKLLRAVIVLVVFVGVAVAGLRFGGKRVALGELPLTAKPPFLVDLEAVGDTGAVFRTAGSSTVLPITSIKSKPARSSRRRSRGRGRRPSVSWRSCRLLIQSVRA